MMKYGIFLLVIISSVTTGKPAYAIDDLCDRVLVETSINSNFNDHLALASMKLLDERRSSVDGFSSSFSAGIPIADDLLKASGKLDSSRQDATSMLEQESLDFDKDQARNLITSFLPADLASKWLDCERFNRTYGLILWPTYSDDNSLILHADWKAPPLVKLPLRLAKGGEGLLITGGSITGENNFRTAWGSRTQSFLKIHRNDPNTLVHVEMNLGPGYLAEVDIPGIPKRVFTDSENACVKYDSEHFCVECEWYADEWLTNVRNETQVPFACPNMPVGIKVIARFGALGGHSDVNSSKPFGSDLVGFHLWIDGDKERTEGNATTIVSTSASTQMLSVNSKEPSLVSAPSEKPDARASTVRVYALIQPCGNTPGINMPCSAHGWIQVFREDVQPRDHSQEESARANQYIQQK